MSLSLIRSAGTSALMLAMLVGGCGNSSNLTTKTSTANIVNGVPADVSELPGMATTFLLPAALPEEFIAELPDETFAPNGLIYCCGATVIHERWALTAAHCMFQGLGPDAYRVGVGRTDRSAFPSAELLEVEQVVIHPLWTDELVIVVGQPPQKRVDLALLKLRSNAGVEPVEWVDADEAPALTRAGTAATVYGWGLTSEGGRPSDTLRKVTLPIITAEQCRQIYPDIYASEVQLCAGPTPDGRSGCNGDSGGPLVVLDGKNDDDVVQIGVVHGGLACGSPQYASIFTRVGYAADWIAATIQ